MGGVAITGGTGTFGRAFVAHLLRDPAVTRIAIISRDELKQAEMAAHLGEHAPLRFFLGDVRDRDRLTQAFYGCDTVVHAAALKRVDAIANNPSEVRRTNIEGSANVIQAAIAAGVAKVVMISSDKACLPTNSYGVSKAQMEHEAIASNTYSVPRGTKIAVVRYGNVVGSRGSVVHLFRAAVAAGRPIPITDPAMTRFWLTIDDAIGLVTHTLEIMRGGELVIPVAPAARVVDLAEAIAPAHPTVVVGLRPGGEKLHEILLNDDEARRTVVTEHVFIVNPAVHPWCAEAPWEGDPLPPEYVYRSDLVGWRLSVEELRKIVEGVPA